MTRSDAIKKWLLKFQQIKIIDTDRVGANPENYGLYKQPVLDEVKYIDGSGLRTEYYYFLARENAQQEIDRRENYDLLEGLEVWIDTQVAKGNTPEIEGFEEIGIANSFYLQEETEEEAVYQIGIYVSYLRRN